MNNDIKDLIADNFRFNEMLTELGLRVKTTANSVKQIVTIDGDVLYTGTVSTCLAWLEGFTTASNDTSKNDIEQMSMLASVYNYDIDPDGYDGYMLYDDEEVLFTSSSAREISAFILGAASVFENDDEEII